MPSELTLRDHFAALAMQGLLAADNSFELSCKDIAEIAYATAEAMLKERQEYAL